MTLLAALLAPDSTPHGTWEWVISILSIVLIDIVLAGDNAVVIALAVKRLDKKDRMVGIAVGAGVAVLFRIGLTAVASKLLAVPFLKLIGGLLIIWIAIKLLHENTGEENSAREAKSRWQAIWLIAVADITMSLDNVLAVAGASHGNLNLLIFGLVLSIPLVVFTSNALAKAMDRFPIVVYAGAAILGFIGGGMIVTDSWLSTHLPSNPWLGRAAEFGGAALVLITAKLLALGRSTKTSA